MGITDFTIRILVLFIPGLIAFILVDRLTVHGKVRIQDIVIYSLLLGFLSYLMFFLIRLVGGYWSNSQVTMYFLQSLGNPSAPIMYSEVVYVSLCSIGVGIVVAYSMNRKLLHRIAHKLGVSKKFGEMDVWSYALNLPIPEWITVRDLGNDVMYEGWIMAFSDGGVPRDELLLRDVIVYRNATAEELYRSPAIYLARNRENLVVEFPRLEFTDEIERPSS